MSLPSSSIIIIINHQSSLIMIIIVHIVIDIVVLLHRSINHGYHRLHGLPRPRPPVERTERGLPQVRVGDVRRKRVLPIDDQREEAPEPLHAFVEIHGPRPRLDHGQAVLPIHIITIIMMIIIASLSASLSSLSLSATSLPWSFLTFNIIVVILCQKE